MSSLHADKGWLFIAFRLRGRLVRLYLGLRDTRANRRLAIVKDVRGLVLRREWATLAEPRIPHPHNPQNFSRRHWPAILKRAQVEHREFYQCRHTYATRLLAQGMELQEIARRMGHTDLKMLLNHYLKWAPEKGESIDAQAKRSHR